VPLVGARWPSTNPTFLGTVARAKRRKDFCGRTTHSFTIAISPFKQGG
jgi:hypothetical protein